MWLATSARRTYSETTPGVDPMENLLFHNPTLRGIQVVVLAEMILLLVMIRNRKPGASAWAAAFSDPNSLTERGLRVRWWCNVATTIIVFWVFDALVFGAPRAAGWIGS
jgi:hypothetical protein